MITLSVVGRLLQFASTPPSPPLSSSSFFLFLFRFRKCFLRLVVTGASELSESAYAEGEARGRRCWGGRTFYTIDAH